MEFSHPASREFLLSVAYVCQFKLALGWNDSSTLPILAAGLQIMLEMDCEVSYLAACASMPSSGWLLLPSLTLHAPKSLLF